MNLFNIGRRGLHRSSFRVNRLKATVCGSVFQSLTRFEHRCYSPTNSSVNKLRKEEESLEESEIDLQDLYPPEGSFMTSNLREVPGTGRPVPINVSINDYAPLRHEPKYKNLVCEVQMRAYEAQDLDYFADFALRAAFYLKIPASGVIPLPRRTERWTVIRSPFVQAKSKENFERITSKRLIRLYDANPEVVEVWLAVLRKYAMTGVGMKAHIYTHEDLDFVDRLEATQPSDGILSPKNVHFGQTANSEVAKAVLSILEDSVFKPLLDESNSDISPGAPAQAIKTGSKGIESFETRTKNQEQLDENVERVTSTVQSEVKEVEEKQTEAEAQPTIHEQNELQEAEGETSSKPEVDNTKS